MVSHVSFDIKQYTDRIAGLDCMTYEGSITRVAGSIIESKGPTVAVGQLCEIHTHDHGKLMKIKAEVIGFRETTTILMPLEKLNSVQAGDRVLSCYSNLEVSLSDKLLGRILDGLGQPLDNGGQIPCSASAPIHQKAPHPLKRPAVREPFLTGIRAIDIAITMGKGQRMGIFAGSGVGKSTLLGEIAKGSEADVNVIALVGERGREVNQFIDDCLGENGLRKSVVVVATADVTPLLKVKAAYTATTIAEYFRSCGLHVLFMMDSITRVANAQREIGLAGGEPPTSRGYPPSVFSQIPALAERLGNTDNGSITGIYTVLVERDDFTEPVADTVRATLDGHIALSRQLAERGQFPAVDILASVSRVMRDVSTEEHLDIARKLKTAVSTYLDAEDLIKIGAYAKGTSPLIDRAVELMPEISAALGQRIDERESFEDALARFKAITDRWEF
jgi:flagellum-specific ATP synthase